MFATGRHMKRAEFSDLKQSVKALLPKQKKQLEEILSKPEDVSLVAKLVATSVLEALDLSFVG